MKSRKYLKWVAEQPCIYCGRDSQAHHLRIMALGSGMGKKVPDYFTLPVCYEHHAECHSGVIDKETQMRWCLQTIDKAIKCGIIEGNF
jgi:hypothetical protein|tara:strand:- start:282 stop:545 length:264 start_codon:yes stop_codon:yes gene_type:complete